MWIWVIIIAVIVGAAIGYFSSGKGEDAAAKTGCGSA